jgi:hypothetical protein
LFFEKKSNINKTHQLITWIGTAILEVKAPHSLYKCILKAPHGSMRALDATTYFTGVVSYARKMFMESATGTNNSTQASSRGGMPLQTMHHQGQIL